MGCHVMDVPFYALKLGYPIAFKASSTPVNRESPPVASRIEYTSPARKDLPKLAMPELKFTWSVGGLLPIRPEELPDGEVMGDWSGGNLYTGTKGEIISSM